MRSNSLPSSRGNGRGRYSVDSGEEIKEESVEKDNSSSYDEDEMEAIDNFLVGSRKEEEV